MAKQIKGCINSECIANKKKMKYKNSDSFCTKCGNGLVSVCKKCYVPLPSDYKKTVCDRCLAAKSDKKDKQIKRVEQAGAGLAGLAGVAVVGKKAFDIAKKVVFKGM